MDFLSHFTPLAHAYLIEGNHVVVEKELIDMLEKEHGITFRGNPDAWKETFHTFTIDDAREIKHLASNRKIGEGKRVFVICTDGMTREASNALLKTLEEPGEDTHFFIITPSIKRILPTILSRVRVVLHKGSKVSDILPAPADFLAQSPAQRLTFIKELLVKLEKEEVSKSLIASFIDDVIRSTRKEKQALIASYNRDQSASMKMILEYLALTA